MKVKEESEKVGLKLNIQKTKIMASVPIISWQIDVEKVKTMADFIIIIILAKKITADGDCSHEIKRCLPLGTKRNYGQDRQYIIQQKHCFSNKGPSNQSFGFSSSGVWM